MCTMGSTMSGTTYWTRRITTVKPCFIRACGNSSVHTWKGRGEGNAEGKSVFFSGKFGKRRRVNYSLRTKLQLKLSSSHAYLHQYHVRSREEHPVHRLVEEQGGGHCRHERKRERERKENAGMNQEKKKNYLWKDYHKLFFPVLSTVLGGGQEEGRKEKTVTPSINYLFFCTDAHTFPE